VVERFGQGAWREAGRATAKTLSEGRGCAGAARSAILAGAAAGALARLCAGAAVCGGGRDDRLTPQQSC